MKNLPENPMRSLIGPGDKELSPLKKIQMAMEPWATQKAYPGPSGCGIERIHLALASFVKVLAIESPGWYKYPSSTRPDQDGKDWRVVVPADPAVVVNFHSLVHDKRWTVVTTTYATKEIDTAKVGDFITHDDPWIRSMLWSIKLAKTMETSGYHYSQALGSMSQRLQTVNMLRELKNCMEPDITTTAKKLGAHGGLPPLTIAINSWRTAKGRQGCYEKPANGRDFGIITVDSEIMSSAENMQEIVRHNMIHAILNENCRSNSHGPVFQSIAREIGLPRHYRD